MADPGLKKPQRSEFVKDQEDRVAADAEMVGQILNPNRTSETVRFPDPSLPGRDGGTNSGAPQSMAELEMARRTDAGRREPLAATTATTKGNKWFAVVAVLVVAILALAWMWAA